MAPKLHVLRPQNNATHSQLHFSQLIMLVTVFTADSYNTCVSWVILTDG